MKIYPNKSNIIVTKNVNNFTDIPLAYVDTERLDYKISTVINNGYQHKTKNEVLPYDKMNKNLVCLFDKNGNQIDYLELTKHLKREGNDYVFVPYNSTIFSPKSFEYSVIAKKYIKYNSRMQYDIKVCSKSEIIANSLMPIFGDAPYKKLAPSNILINSGSMSYKDLVTTDYKTKDIFFISLNNLTTDDVDMEFDKEEVLKYKTNIFAFMSSMFAEEVTEETKENKEEVKMYIGDNVKEYILKEPNIYEKVTLNSNKFFNIPNNTEETKYYNLFNATKETPILIEENIGKGFMVYVADELLFNTANFSKVIYEIIFFIYSKCYIETVTYNEWITDIMPDFVVVNNKITKKDKFISSIELHKMFGLGENEVSPYEVKIDKELYPFVKFTGIYKNYLSFEKDTEEENEIYKDPIKKDGSISIFTSRQDIIYFNEFLYKIDDSLEENIKVERIDNSIKITVRPFRHSSSSIYIKTLTSLSIPLSYVNNNGDEIQISNADYYLICKQNESASYLEYKNSEEYKKDDGLILATIQVRQSESNILLYDMRQRGGGLPEGEKDDYNCFDIGHIYGRPYRRGGSLIIKLPKKLEEHRSMIEETVKRYCVAEEYPIIIFEGDNNE